MGRGAADLTAPDDAQITAAIGVQVGPCPVCGAMGDVPPKTWAVGALRTLKQLEPDQLQSLRDVLLSVEEGATTTALAGTSISTSSVSGVLTSLPSDLRPLIRDAERSPWSRRFLIAVIPILVWMYPAQGAVVGHAVDRAVEQAIHQLLADVSAPGFPAAAHRQARTVAASEHGDDDQSFVDSVSIWPEE